jgi:methyl-accepting chemotaxis protein
MSNGEHRRRPVRQLYLGVATFVVLGVTTMTAVAAAAPVDTPPATVPTDTTVPPASDAPTVTTPTEVPPAFEPGPGSVPDSEDTGFTDTGFDDENTDVSRWWWIAGIVVAVVAVIGLVVALRRRDTTERWAQRASLLCDSARALSVTLSTRLADPSPWSIPTRYTEQHRRCAGYVTELTASAPDGRTGELLAAVATDTQQLHDAVTGVATAATQEDARTAVQPRLDQLAASLTALEELTTSLAMHAALPSGRSAN